MLRNVRHGQPVALVAAGAILLGLLVWLVPAVVGTANDRADSRKPALLEAKTIQAETSAKSWEQAQQEKLRQEIRRKQDEILARLRANTPLDINTAYLKLVPALVALDPAAAAAWAEAQTNAKWREDLMMVVAQSWAGLDPDAAEDWAANLPNPPGKPRERDNVVSYVAFAVAKTDSARAVQVLEDTNINPERREILVQNLATQWADKSSDIQPLTNWLQQMPDGAEREQLLTRVALAQAQTNPVAAANLVSSSLKPGPGQQNAAMEVLRLWAWSDPDAAAEWVNQFPRDGAMFKEAIATLSETARRRNGTDAPPAPSLQASETPSAAR
jgi:hypothetical protein